MLKHWLGKSFKILIIFSIKYIIFCFGQNSDSYKEKNTFPFLQTAYVFTLSQQTLKNQTNIIFLFLWKLW